MVVKKSLAFSFLNFGLLSFPSCRRELSIDAIKRLEAPRPTIVHVKTRDKHVTIRSGKSGPLYTVKAVDGKTLARDLSAGELSVMFPELSAVLDKGIAESADVEVKALGDLQRK